jgi:hypothetical protein
MDRSRAAPANARFENQAFQNQQISVQDAKDQLILILLKEKPSEGWSSLSPLAVLTPSKPRLILACIVGIKIDVQARYSSPAEPKNQPRTRIAIGTANGGTLVSHCNYRAPVAP